MKKLSDIALDITEPQYRDMEELSYSTLAKYERTGFNGLSSLFDSVESSSLTFGSAVDSIITGGMQEFNERFYVTELPEIEQKEITMCNALLVSYGKKSLLDYNDSEIIQILEENEYHKNWKLETRVKVFKEHCTGYYSVLESTGGRQIISTETYNKVIDAVNALKSSEATKFYFAEDNPFDGIERCYQPKFNCIKDKIGYRCMMDLVIVDHNNKTVIPCDLKTSSHKEWDFESSFTQWQYMIQARLYYRILKNNLEKDDYFKDFSIQDYRFIVVNKESLTPLVWEFPFTKYIGDLKDGEGNIYRDPYTIGKELHKYLEETPRVPFDIELEKPNIIKSVKPV